MKPSWTIRSYDTRQIFSCLLAFALVFAFGLHDLELEHPHQHPHGTQGHHDTGVDVSEYMHPMDRKSFIAVISVFLVAAIVALGFGRIPAFAVLPMLVPVSDIPISRSRTHLALLLRKGILHPRRYF